MTNITAFVVLFTTSYITYTQACFCMRGHLQNFVCDPKSFVIKAHVVSSAVVSAKTGNYNVKEITVDVLEDFKNNIQGDKLVLTTAEYSTFCGVSLPDDSCYVVSGTFEEGSPIRYRINTCGFQKRCSAMTDVQLSGLNGGYAEGCENNCKVLSPYAAEEDIGCNVNYQTDNISCLQNYGVCDRCDHNQCNGRQCMWRITNTPNPGCSKIIYHK
ncbi:Hypothetical predicted protein [Mytilus galloprovincialis]|uniref:NTR domain-containing protein n=1 Tax=Mytilus galloprovincialis TaxID=29158 RepID=A0A8B6BGR0_MYTGA|nr:Hypothetical predicted protein [Mytilus galloprovincialis]